ncbi:MAG: hypothetical protein ACR2N3_15110 [Pyrinomonadaceae bacterium]
MKNRKQFPVIDSAREQSRHQRAYYHFAARAQREDLAFAAADKIPPRENFKDADTRMIRGSIQLIRSFSPDAD